MNDLSGNIALVTGANRGIGREIALALALAGADVAVNYKSHESEARETCARISEYGRNCLPVRADVSVGEEVSQLVEAIERELGAVSILVNNAGVSGSQPFDQISEDNWNEVIRINLTSVFLVTRAVLPGMRKRGWGRIINISSIAAQTGGVIGPHYAASKAGILGLTHSYSSLLAKEGITVNAIAPALIETAMLEDMPRARAELIPVGRFGKSEEVAEAALMLARNAYITGQTINVNGGWYMS